jgi:hypothetical protein
MLNKATIDLLSADNVETILHSARKLHDKYSCDVALWRVEFLKQHGVSAIEKDLWNAAHKRPSSLTPRFWKALTTATLFVAAIAAQWYAADSMLSLS